MNLRKKIALKRHRFFPLTAHNADLFRKKALSFSRFFGLSVLSFSVGVYAFHLFGAPLSALYKNQLLLFFSDPFLGISTPFEYACRILFYASPSLFQAAVLLLSSIPRNKQRALYFSLCAVQLLQGLYHPIASELLKKGLLTVSIPILRLYQLTGIIGSFLFCIYAYRLSLCFSLGFPNRSPAPGITARFFSFTARLLLWLIFPVIIRSVAVFLGN